MSYEITVEELQHMLEDFPPEAVVRIAAQPSWPFEYTLDRNCGPLVMTGLDPQFCRECTSDTECDECPHHTDDEDPIVYIVEGNQIGYLPPTAKEEIGW